MKTASVILDIPTQSLDAAYTYVVPEELDEVVVGCAVLVEFGTRKAVGYVIDVEDCDAGPGEEFGAEAIAAAAMEPGAKSAAAPAVAGPIAAAAAAAKSATAAAAPVRSLVFHDESEVLPAIRCDQSRALKPILACLSEPYFDEFGARLIQFIAHEYVAPLGACVHLLTPVGRTPKLIKTAGQWELKKPAKRRRKARASEVLTVTQIAHRAQERETLDLTEGQAQAAATIEAALERAAGECVVVDGVTGSGKTEVYLRAIRAALVRGAGAIVLVPEIALTPQTVARFEGRFGETVAVMHSRMTGAQRFDQWEEIRSGRKRVVVGARSALFSPMENLGLIIIDEEHETTYKQESAPRYHAREVATWMARELGALLVLGSATPSIETLCRTKADPSWIRVSLPGRANGRPLPPVEVVDMAREFGSGFRSMFSRRLKEALFAAIDADHKAVLMLNQRGFATFLLCRSCGYVPECPTCSVSLTYHEHGTMLMCHHCARRLPAPPVCPACGSPYLRKFGSGTQRVEAELIRLLVDNGYVLAHEEDGEGVPKETSQCSPSANTHLATPDGAADGASHVLAANAASHCTSGTESNSSSASTPRAVRVIRMDSDTTSSRDAHERLLAAFAQPGPAVLLGTQMIAKGLDFDEVVLVGVISADTQLRLPDFRSAERTFNLVEQVAGRAGRGALTGRVLVQTYLADAAAIQAAATYDRRRFLADELPKRRMLGYPPYTRLANLLIWGANAEEVREVACELEARVAEVIRDVVGEGWVSLGAAPCALERLRGQYRWHILVKAPRDAAIAQLMEPVIRRRRPHKRVNVVCDVDPFSLL